MNHYHMFTTEAPPSASSSLRQKGCIALDSLNFLGSSAPISSSPYPRTPAPTLASQVSETDCLFVTQWPGVVFAIPALERQQQDCVQSQQATQGHPASKSKAKKNYGTAICLKTKDHIRQYSI